MDEAVRGWAETDPDRAALTVDDGDHGAEISYGELELQTRPPRQASLSEPAVVVETDHTLVSAVALVAALRSGRAVQVIDRTLPPATRTQLRRRLTLADGRVEDPSRKSAVPDPSEPGRSALLSSEALVLATGGSTGSQRLVVDLGIRRSPRLPRQVRVSTRLNWVPGQRQGLCSPLSHASGLTFFVDGLVDGNHTFLQRRFDAARLLTRIADGQVTWLQCTPFHLNALRRACHARPHAVVALHALVHMSAPCPTALKRFWHDRLDATNVFELYGSTEGMGTTICRGDEWESRPGTVGRPFLSRVRVLDDNFRPVPHGTDGLLYWHVNGAAQSKRLESTAVKTFGDYVTLGDRGSIDPEGYLYPEARPLERVTVAGETVLVTDVEDVLLSHPGVHDAGVTPFESDTFGQQLIALVVADPARVGPSELRRWARSHLTPAAVPRHIHVVNSLPRQVSGKLQRRQLNEQAGELAATTSGYAPSRSAGPSAGTPDGPSASTPLHSYTPPDHFPPRRGQPW